MSTDTAALARLQPTYELVNVDSDYPDVSIRVVRMTPSFADRLLTSNIHNRGARDEHVHKLARDMAAGTFRFTGDPIRIDKDGVLLDGQHRLMACVEAKVPFDTVLIEGLESEAQQNIDQNIARKFSDYLVMHGCKNPFNVAAIVRMEELVATAPSLETAVTGRNRIPSFNELVARYERDPDHYDELTKRSQGVAKGLPVSGTVVATLMTHFARISEDDARDFFIKLRNPGMLPGGHPVLALRNALIEERNRSAGGSLGARWTYGIIIKAWNLYRDGTTVGSLKARFGGANPEKFPEAH